MGQRHQIYIVTKKNSEYRALSAHHHQWCYGLTAATNLTRLAVATERALSDSWSLYALEPRHCDVLVKYVYGVDPQSGIISMVHDEADCLIQDESIRPEWGDNNDGAALLVIDHDSKEVRGCLFTPSFVEGQYGAKAKAFTPWTPKEYLNFYYRGEELFKYLKDNPHRAKFFDLAPKPILAPEFKKILKNSLPKPKKVKKAESDDPLRILPR